MGIEAATLALAIMSTGTALYTQDQNAKAQTETNFKKRDETVEAMHANMSQLELQKQQAAEQAGQKQFENNMAAQRAMATAKVSAGENGVSGLSVDALLAELDGSRARYNDSVAANLRDTNAEINHQRENLHRGAKSTVNGLKTPQQPDYIGAALKIGTDYVDYKKAKK